MEDRTDELLELLFHGEINRISDITPYNMDTPIRFLMLKHNSHTQTREYLIDRDFWGLPGEGNRNIAINMLLNEFYKYQSEKEE